jgi:tRNA (guanine37-N1)-methyltransferase
VDDTRFPGDEATSVPLLTVDIVSLFPHLFDSWLGQGVVSRAVARGIVRVRLVNLRAFGIGRHQVTDDYPFGGGAGMVMKPEPLFAAVESLEPASDTPIVLLSPRGRRFDQRCAEELAQRSRLILVGGHYEGVDERVLEHLVTDEISIGDYVLSGGELAAMVVCDAVVRLLPGALASQSTREESFRDGLLEYPHYTRPATFRGWSVPEVLLSGHHGEIARWRRLEALRSTFLRRPDLLHEESLTVEERADIDRWRQETVANSEDAAGEVEHTGERREDASS